MFREFFSIDEFHINFFYFFVNFYYFRYGNKLGGFGEKRGFFFCSLFSYFFIEDRETIGFRKTSFYKDFGRFFYYDCFCALLDYFFHVRNWGFAIYVVLQGAWDLKE